MPKSTVGLEGDKGKNQFIANYDIEYKQEKTSQQITEDVVREWYLTICWHLSIQPPTIEIREALESEYGSSGGHFNSSKYHIVIISNSTNEIDILRTLAHECRHAWQAVYQRFEGLTLEDDADNYSEYFLARFQYPVAAGYAGNITTKERKTNKIIILEPQNNTGCLIPICIFISLLWVILGT